MMTTMAIGEEGQDSGFSPIDSPRNIPPSGKATTLAVGEEGQDCGHSCPIRKKPIRTPDPQVSTKMVGEEGQDCGLPRPFNLS